MAPKTPKDVAVTDDGITTLDDIRAARLPESGPSESPKTVTLTSATGTKVTVPDRMAKTLKAQGFK